MTKRLILVGGGEHARVVAETASALGYEVLGCVADRTSATFTVLADDHTYLGEDDGAPSERSERFGPHSLHLAVGGIRTMAARRGALAGLAAADAPWATLIHPTAWVSPSAVLGIGVFVGPGAIVHTGAVIGDHVIVNTGAIVEHDVRVGAGSQLAPGAVTGGGARIGAWSLCGLGCRIREHTVVGDESVVGMGAVVVANVPDGAIVMGCPARPRKT